jgi:hypothetical protein
MCKQNANPIVHDAVGSKRDASLFDAVPSMVVAAAGGGRIPPGWDPYEEVPYISPPNPYDTCMDDPWNEVTMVFSLFCSPFLFEPYFCWFPSNY